MSVDQFLLSSDTTDLNYPEIRPTLDLNFARVKALDPRITFTRSSGGSYVGADGILKYAGVNEARFDHDPVTCESLGLLIEESRTNLLVRSEEFDTTWAPTRASVSTNTTSAPNGTITADSLIEDSTANTSHFLNQAYTYSAGANTLSVYVKASTRNEIRLIGNDGTTTFAVYFDVSTGTVGAATGGAIGAIQALSNGWYRCIITFTAAAGTGFARVGLAVSGNQTYTGDGTSGIYIWGAQLETGAFPTSYIPTLGSTRTRAADVARITGTNFSSWYREDEGTIYAQGGTMDSEGNPYLVALNNGTSSNRLELRRVRVNNSAQFIISTLGVTEALSGVNNSWPPRVNGRIIGAYAKNDVRMAFNGTLGNQDNSANLPTINQMIIGISDTNFGINQPIGRVTYWPKRLPNAQLQALTR